MSIYRSEEGRRALEACYERALSKLNVDVSEDWIETRHGRTHVLTAGPSNGEPVLTFHGGNTTNPMVLEWYSELAKTHRLIAPDTIGQPGKSDQERPDPKGDGYGEWVIDLLDAYEIDTAPMIGTSYGAGIVLRVAAFAPQRVARAALVVPAGFGTGPFWPLIQVGVPSVLYRFISDERLMDGVLMRMCADPEPDPVVRDTIAAALRHVKLDRSFPTASRSELEAFTRPVQVFVASKDPFFPADAIAPRASERLPGPVHIETLDGEKHILSPAGQQRVTERIASFLDNEPASSGTD